MNYTNLSSSLAGTSNSAFSDEGIGLELMKLHWLDAFIKA
jgi:hypothetical protein